VTDRSAPYREDRGLAPFPLRANERSSDIAPLFERARARASVMDKEATVEGP
jgi:hypothetical protein